MVDKAKLFILQILNKIKSIKNQDLDKIQYQFLIIKRPLTKLSIQFITITFMIEELLYLWYRLNN